ncbi:hypothetical protein [Peribacillus muralis]|nr:hypothetical protein [Peribacillus muralis]
MQKKDMISIGRFWGLRKWSMHAIHPTAAINLKNMANWAGKEAKAP